METQTLDFDTQKTLYFSDFATSHLNSFRPHYEHGETLGKGPEVWRNVSEHCLVAGVLVDVLSEAVGLEPADRDKVVKAALLHDWYKKHEVTAQNEARKAGELSYETLVGSKQTEDDTLRAMGLPEDIIQLTDANIPEDEEGPKTLPEKIVWYVDAVLSHTDPVSLQQRFEEQESGWNGTSSDAERAQRNIAYSELYRQRYNGRSLFDVQREIGPRIEKELADRMGYEGEAQQLPFYLQSKLNERINAQ